MKYGRTGIAMLLAALMLLCAAGSAFAEGDAAPAPEEPQYVEAATVDELLAAIAPNTVVTLTGRSYDLTRAKGYGIYGGKYYGWNMVYDDGSELEISHVKNLTIRAAKPGTELVTVPRYACVLKFVDCEGVTLEGFTAGHTEGEGFCTGSVLNMQSCREMLVDGCELYGCGTYGLELEHCRGVHAVNTVIRDCSYGALIATGCSDVLLDGCRIHGVEAFSGVLELSGCHDCACVNTRIRDCAAESLVRLQTAKDFYLAGCEVRANRLGGMFSCTGYPVVVEGCVFEKNAGAWYLDNFQTSERAVDPSGRTYDDAELEAMTLAENVSWTAPEEREPLLVAPEVSDDGMIHVRNVDELLASIAPNASIYLEDGVYDLSEASGYGTHGGDHWYWMSCYDGPGLVIHNAENLTITAGGPHRARIVAVPRYCEVLSFEGCDGLTLRGVTLGHTQSLDNAACAGGVLTLQGCRNVTLEDCSLFGCGTIGVTAMSCRDMEVLHTEIHHCTVGAFYLYDCDGVAVNGCNVHDIGDGSGEFLFQHYECRNIAVDGRELPENRW